MNGSSAIPPEQRGEERVDDSLLPQRKKAQIRLISYAAIPASPLHAQRLTLSHLATLTYPHTHPPRPPIRLCADLVMQGGAGRMDSRQDNISVWVRLRWSPSSPGRYPRSPLWVCTALLWYSATTTCVQRALRTELLDSFEGRRLTSLIMRSLGLCDFSLAHRALQFAEGAERSGVLTIKFKVELAI